MDESERAALQGELTAARRELAECRASLPAHSIRPHQVLRIEALEERIEELTAALGAGVDPS